VALEGIGRVVLPATPLRFGQRKREQADRFSK
jgi:hypothetical protein